MDVGAHFIANEAIYYKNFPKYKKQNFIWYVDDNIHNKVDMIYK